MAILISDTSVIIDLERSNLIDHVFALSFDFAVPDFLYEKELKEYGGQHYLDQGLQIKELDGDGIASAIAYRTRKPKLSFPDCSALALARQNTWALLTGDRVLRELSESEGVECHGVLWVLDLLGEEGVVSYQALHDGLLEMSKHPRCRLPRRAIEARITSYQLLL